MLLLSKTFGFTFTPKKSQFIIFSKKYSNKFLKFENKYISRVYDIKFTRFKTNKEHAHNQIKK